MADTENMANMKDFYHLIQIVKVAYLLLINNSQLLLVNQEELNYVVEECRFFPLKRTF